MSDPIPASSAEHDAAADSAPGLEAFFADVEKRAYRMAYIATGDREEALDILQDSMLRMFRKYRYSPVDSRRAIFYRVLSNRICDWHRRRRIRAALGLTVGTGREQDEHAGDERLQPLRQIESSDTITQVERALRQLSPRQRQVFLLRCWEGFNVNDTAQAVGCSPAGVKVHLFRALRTLRKQLGGLYAA